MADEKSFKGLIAEQKQTNKLLQQQIVDDNDGSKLGTSIKNSLGEIINDRLIGRLARGEHDQTQEQIVKSAEKRSELDIEHNKSNQEIFSKIAKNLTGASTGNGKPNTSAADEESFKDENARDNARFAKFLGPKSFLGKGFLGLTGDIVKLVKNLYGKGKGILKVLFGVAAYGLLLKYLNSPGFKEFMKNDGPAKIAEAAKRIFGKGGLIDQITNFFTGDSKNSAPGFFQKILIRLKKLGKDVFNASKGKDDNNEEYTYTDVIKDNITTITGIVGVLYAKQVLKYGFQAGKWLASKGFTVLKRNVFPFLIGRGTGLGLGARLLRGAGLVGIVLSLYEGVKYTFAKETQERIKNGKSTWLSAGIGGFVGSFFQLGSDILSIIASAVGLDSIAKALDAQNYKLMIDELALDIINSFDNMFTSLYRGFKKLLFGTNIFDEESEIKKLQKDNIKKIKMAEQLEAGGNPNLIAQGAVLRAQVKQNEKTIEKKRESISKAKEGDKGVSAFGEDEGNIPLQLKNLAGREAALARFKTTGSGFFLTMGDKEAQMKKSYLESLKDEDTSNDLDLRLNPKTGGLELSGQGGFSSVTNPLLINNITNPKEIVTMKPIIQIGPPQQNMATIFGNY